MLSDDPALAPPAPPSTKPARPWQVSVAVLLTAVWWVGSYAGLIGMAGGGLGSDDVFPLVGVGLWSIVVFFLLRNTWRGGKASFFVAQVTLLFGGAYEAAGILSLVIGLLGAGFLPLWLSVLMTVAGTCPLVAAKLLVAPAAREYAPQAWAGKRPEQLLTFFQFLRKHQ